MAIRPALERVVKVSMAATLRTWAGIGFVFFKMKVATDSETIFCIIQHMYIYIYTFSLYIYYIVHMTHIYT